MKKDFYSLKCKLFKIKGNFLQQIFVNYRRIRVSGTRYSAQVFSGYPAHSSTHLSRSTYILTGTVVTLPAAVWSARRSHTRTQYWPVGGSSGWRRHTSRSHRPTYTTRPTRSTRVPDISRTFNPACRCQESRFAFK